MIRASKTVKRRLRVTVTRIRRTESQGNISVLRVVCPVCGINNDMRTADPIGLLEAGIRKTGVGDEYMK